MHCTFCMSIFLWQARRVPSTRVEPRKCCSSLLATYCARQCACVAPRMAATAIPPRSFRCADFQFCQNRLRSCDSRAGTGRNRSGASINPRLAFAPLPRACVTPPMAATTVSPCSFRRSWPALISNLPKTGSGVVILGPALAAIDPERPTTQD